MNNVINDELMSRAAADFPDLLNSEGEWDSKAAKSYAARYCAQHGICAISNAENDLKRHRMVCDDGHVYRERADGYWVEDTPAPSVLYLGASKHAAGVTLMPFQVRIHNVWINLATGAMSLAEIAEIATER